MSENGIDEYAFYQLVDKYGRIDSGSDIIMLEYKEALRTEIIKRYNNLKREYYDLKFK